MPTGTDINRPGEPSKITLKYMWATGHLFLVTMLLLFVILGIKVGSPYDNVWQLVLAHIVSGRAGNVGLGLMQGFNNYFLLYQCCMVDFIIMFYVYPLFVSGYQHLSAWPFIGLGLKRTHELALEHKKRIAPYGAVGLMLFVIFPFWSTGPLVGVLVGYLLGMSTRLTFTTVIVGDIIAVAAWTWGYDKLYNHNRQFAIILLIIIFALAIGGAVYAKIRKRKN
jgi:uncharacterized membrane protein